MVAAQEPARALARTPAWARARPRLPRIAAARPSAVNPARSSRAKPYPALL